MDPQFNAADAAAQVEPPHREVASIPATSPPPLPNPEAVPLDPVFRRAGDLPIPPPPGGEVDATLYAIDLPGMTLTTSWAVFPLSELDIQSISQIAIDAIARRTNEILAHLDEVTGARESRRIAQEKIQAAYGQGAEDLRTSQAGQDEDPGPPRDTTQEQAARPIPKGDPDAPTVDKKATAAPPKKRRRSGKA